MFSRIRRKSQKSSISRGFPAPFAGLGEPPTADYRGVPTMSCPCGSEWLVMVFRFDTETRLPGLLLLDGMCACCGALLTLACPGDEEVMTDGVQSV